MKKIFEVEDLDCAHCAAKIEKAVSQIEGVNEVTVSFLTQKITLDAQDDKFDAVVKEMVKIAKKTEPDIEILGI